uniref:Uncharacterized protein n=1 Tax=Ralstonia solanacearum TaxID=305 RepID=A0A0S4VBK4_RALSL|nr:protein of unknown function [Ralstonia solanacearum]CUV32029.1 protein of unknown function [Ralstonia solanacearum]CUV42911.1 protein of unknown function [Ralstonia solanacearum]CUV44214.1 protein of unknown function [Ralstonia solanacearum]CUV57491.1 protein of unknown function [Ralstonia solanacearum]
MCVMVPPGWFGIVIGANDSGAE